ncbi:hypothetical protein GCM10022234_22660 [Aeromicrobium panaciterrae]
MPIRDERTPLGVFEANWPAFNVPRSAMALVNAMTLTRTVIHTTHVAKLAGASELKKLMLVPGMRST